LPIDIRHGTREDAGLITDLIRRMVVDMASHGGHAVKQPLKPILLRHHIIRRFGDL
jgi:hypothetical protein